MKVSASSLAPILRSDTQGRIYAQVMRDPEDEHSLTDLARLTNTSLPTVQREISRAEAAGIMTARTVGRSRLVKANSTHPLYDAIAKIVLTTYGPPAIVGDLLSGLRGVDEVYLFGSWAARYQGTPGRWPNDIDVLVVGRPDRDEIHDQAEKAERRLGQPVQVTFRSRAQWRDSKDPFVTELKSRPLVHIA